MPEKPEVVTVCRALKKKILNKKIVDVKVIWDNIIAKPEKSEFIKNLKGEQIRDITSRGKFIVIILEHYGLLIHLRMEGKFTFRNKNDSISKHEHVIFTLSSGEEMRYHDVRKFGKMYLERLDELYKTPPLSKLGLEFDDKNLTSRYLLEHFKRNNKYIKTVLLDQSIISGIGNIYDDEILFLSRINPYKRAKTLTTNDCENIVVNTKKVLSEAIKMGGTTIKSFTSEEGVHGLFQNKLLVHGKKGSSCPVCKSTIYKETINGRGTYYCPNCQKMDEELTLF